MKFPLTRSRFYQQPVLWLIVILSFVLALSPVAAQSGPTLPSGFADEIAVAGLLAPRAFTFAPDGRIFILERGSATTNDLNFASVRVFKNGGLLATRALTINTCGDSERGALGIALDVNFASNGYFYLYYTRQSTSGAACGYNTYTNGVPGPRNRISRFTMVGDTANPATERILVDNIVTDVGYHNAGDLHVSSDGYLYATTGDGGISSLAPDTGTLNGKVLRILPTAGDAGGYTTPGNPFDTASGARYCGLTPQPGGTGPCREVFAYGLRNPFRFSLQPGTNIPFAGDVGGGVWEEINQISAGGNYGWPQREGPCPNGVLCVPPYTQPAGLVNPIYQYSHNAVNANVDSAIIGGGFYSSSSYPPEYLNNYFFADSIRGFIRRLVYNSSAGTWSAPAQDFATNVPGAIGLKMGPDGSMYYLSFTSDSARVDTIHRIRYVAAQNIPPTAKISITTPGTPSNPTYTFSAAGSSDPDNNVPLAYVWDFGDGTAPVTTSNLTVSHTFTNNQNSTVTLRARDSLNALSAPVTVTVYAANQPATGQIVLTNLTDANRAPNYYAGDEWSYSVANAVDPDGPALPTSAYSWAIVFHHRDHTHPFIPSASGTSGSFIVPVSGETDPVVWYRVILRITDARGEITTIEKDINPILAQITLTTNPAGGQVTLEGGDFAAPYQVTRVVGLHVDISVPSPQTIGGVSRTFDSWSDGGTRTHVLTIPPTNTTYTANMATPPNAPPTITPIGTQSTREGVTINALTINASDPNNDPLTYSVTNLPTGLTFTPATRQVTGTVGVNATSTTVNVSVTDNINPPTTTTFQWNVTDDLPPTFTPAGQTSNVNQVINLSLGTYANDPEVGALRFDLTGGSLPSGLTLAQNGTVTGTITGTPQTYNPTVRVTDSIGQTVSASFSWIVNPAPAGPTTLNLQVNQSSDDVNELNSSLTTNTTTIWAGNGGTANTSYMGLRFNGVTIPRNATIQSAVLQVYSTANQWISISLEIAGQAADTSATFGAGALASTRPLTTARVNSSDNVQWLPNTWYSYSGLQGIVQEIVNRGGWNSGNSLTLVLRGLGPGAWGRKYLAAFDQSATLAPRLVITYTGGGNPPVNQNPTAVIAAPTAGQVFTAGGNGTATVNLSAAGSTDPDGNIATYAWSWTGTTSGTASGSTASPTFGVGSYTLTLTVTDNAGAPGTAVVNFSVQAPQNQNPTAVIAAPTAGQVFTAGGNGTATVNLSAAGSTDPDGNIATYAWAWTGTSTGNASGSTASPTFGVGTYSLTLTVTDNAGAPGTAVVNFSVQAAPQNLPPTITPIGTQSTREGVTIAPLTINASDPNNDPLTYSVTNLPTGLTFTPATRQVTGTVGINAASTTVNVSVTDNINPPTTTTFQWNVTDDLPPTFTPAAQTSNVGQSINLSLATYATDTESASLRFDLTAGSLPSGLTLAQNGTVTGSIGGTAQTYNPTVQVTDSIGQTVSASFSWTVNPAPTGPTTLNLQVNQSSDDVNELNSSLTTNTTTIWTGNGGTANTSYMGLRFNSISIPRGATIQSAVVQVYSTANQWITVNLEIAGQAADTSATFGAGALASTRPLTTARVNSSDNVQWLPNTWYSYSGLQGIVQEIVNRGGWNAGNSLTFIFRGLGPGAWGRKYLAAFEQNAGLAPRLIITYTNPASAMTITNMYAGAPPNAGIQTNTVTRPSPAPVAAFAGSTAGGSAPLTVQFTNQSANATSYLWDFGDGVTTTDVNAAHTYTAPGTYIVTLKASGPGGETLAQTTITVTAPPAPTATVEVVVTSPPPTEVPPEVTPTEAAPTG